MSSLLLSAVIALDPARLKSANPLLTAKQVQDAINAKDQPGPIAYDDVVSYLHMQMVMPAILVSANPAAIAFVDVVNRYTSADLQKPGMLTAVTAQLDALVAGVTEFTTVHSGFILAMGDNKQSIAEVHGHGVVRLGLVQENRP